MTSTNSSICPHGTNPARFGARFRDYDIAVALAPRSADLRLVGATRAGVRAGYTYVRRWLARATSRLYVNRIMISEADPEMCERDPARVVRHEVDQLLDLVELAGARERVARLRLDVAPADRELVSAYPAGGIVLHLGQRWFADGSTLESTVEVARQLRALGRPITLSIPRESAEYVDAFAAAGVADAIARDVPFFAWAALFERAACVVTVDTGATHVASAMRRPTLVAFEHRYFRLNSQEWAPYGVPNVLVRKPGSPDAASLVQFRTEIVRGVEKLLA